MMTATATPPREAFDLLERLCRSCAVSGDEGEVRSIVLEAVRPHLGDRDDLRIDPLGSVLVRKSARNGSGLKVMVAAHMDEVGFMLTSDEEDGIFRFDTVGGIDERYLVGKAVCIGKNHVAGVIGAKPIHLTKPDERKQKVSIDSMRIDVGPGNGNKVEVGDRATFRPEFTILGPSVRAKALDDRFGVAALIHLIQNPPENVDLLAAFTVQEEVGLRGAGVAAHALDPDVAFVLDCTPARDMPVWDGERDRYGPPPDDPHTPQNLLYNARLGAGPALYLSDRSTISDPRLVRHAATVAEDLGIPYQFRQPGGGGTDAGAIHLSRAGIPSMSISVPGRYLHTPASLSRLSDWAHTITLVKEAIERITPQALERIEG